MEIYSYYELLSLCVSFILWVWGGNSVFRQFFFSNLNFCLHLWHVEVPGPGMEPTPQKQPEPLQQQSQILNPLYHQGIPRQVLLFMNFIAGC